MPRAQVQNRVALRKALRAFSADDLKRITKRHYSVTMNKMKSSAKRNAPSESGALRNSISQRIFQSKGARSGTLLRGYVYSDVVYDKMTSHGVPQGGLSRDDADKLSRKWKGVSRRVRTGQDYRRGTRTRKWAWGEKELGRAPNRFMTKGQDFQAMNEKLASDIGKDILLQFSRNFQKQIKVGGKR